MRGVEREAEAEVATKGLRHGDREAATKIVNANLRYVVAIALTYRRYGLALSDLVAEGNFGIVHALRKFDPSRGTRFVTYAAYWIRAYILNFVIRSWSLVGVGSGPLRSKLFFRLMRERARIASLVGEGDVGTELLAERFGAPAEELLSMAPRPRARAPAPDTKGFDDGQTTLVDTLESNAQSQEERFSASEEKPHLKERLRAAIEARHPRDRDI